MILHLMSARTWGGGERYALDVARAFGATVYTPGAEAVDAPLREAGIEVRHLPLRDGLDLRTPRLLARELQRLAAALPDEEGIVVHAHTFHVARTAALARRLMKQGAERVSLVCTRHLARPARRGPLHRWLYGQLDAIIFVSQFAADTFLSSNPPVEARRLHVVPNALSPTLPDVERGAGEEGVVRLLSLGRLAPEKGVHTLLEALESLRALPWRLTIAGTGPHSYLGDLRDRARRGGIANRINWAGHVKDVNPLLRDADIGVAPSVAPEAFGLTLVEYMHAGLAVVCTDTGAQGEVTGDCALLVSPERPECLAEALRALITDPSLRRRLGEEGRRRVDELFRFGRLRGDLERIYRDVSYPSTPFPS